MPVILDDVIRIPGELQGTMVDLLSKVMSHDEADFCTLQFYQEDGEVLHLIAQVGFTATFIEHFRKVPAFDGSACGRAIGSGIPIVVCDIHEDEAFAPHLESVKDANYRAVKSVPLFNKESRKVGVVSTHFKDARWTWNLNSLDGITDELAEVLSHVAQVQHQKNTSTV